jgi:hypothetical protein
MCIRTPPNEGFSLSRHEREPERRSVPAESSLQPRLGVDGGNKSTATLPRGFSRLLIRLQHLPFCRCF